MVIFIPNLKIKVLKVLNNNTEPLHAKDIAEKLNLKPHSIGQQLNSYRLQGLVSRLKHFDIMNSPTKEYYYSITEKGKSRLKFLEGENTSIK